MKVTARIVNLSIKALAESMDISIMVAIVRKLIRNYDIHNRTGFPDSIPIPRRDAAAQIVEDVKNMNLFLPFADILIDFHQNGYMGRKYPITNLREIIKEIQSQGFLYDQEYKMFVEDPSVRKTRNWGVLREGEEYSFAFLRLDIVGSSELVRRYPDDIIKVTYEDLRKIVQKAIDKRNGRVWKWEGDGGLIAYYFSRKNMLATMSSMEIINELFIYNLISCRLDNPLQVRIAVHCGPCAYLQDIEKMNKNESVKRTVEIESKYTKPNTVTISSTVYKSIDQNLAGQFNQIIQDDGVKRDLFNYELRWES